MTRYMLDTNAVSQVIKGHPAVTERMLSTPMAALCISAITEAELLYGLARRPEAKRLHKLVWEFLHRVETLSWSSHVASYYGATRAALEGDGKALAPLDLLIASHALKTSAVLVTDDRAFRQVRDLAVENWAE